MNVLDDLNIDDREKKAITEAARLLREKFHAKEVILFGSKARGDDDMESDIDLLVLTDDQVSWSQRKEINDSLYEIQLKYDVVISPMITTFSNWKDGVFSVMPIHDEISVQGIIA
ncbi:MAG: nucleotidyltransferase domain-containing protein [Deltaproteobacteria bacterium]|nr:nucleotidyltransferase domain-containing protein [Deltaproteobacteria bacterium]